MRTRRTLALALAAGLALSQAPQGVLRGDPALRRAFERRVLQLAADQDCTAEVWAPELERLPAGLALAADPILPAAGTWGALTLNLVRDPAAQAVPAGTASAAAADLSPTATATARARVRLWACVRGWTVTQPLALGSPIGLSCVAQALLDPRALGGQPQQGPLPAGARAARPLAPGQPLLAADLTLGETLAAGERVTLLVRQDGIEAGDEGILLESGADGSLLRAAHRRSGRVVRGRLSGRTLLVED